MFESKIQNQPLEVKTANSYPAPIAVGAIGGSGTRVIATILSDMGVSIGASLNHQLDNLFFTYFFKYRQIRSMSKKDILLLIELFTSANIGPRKILNDVEFELFSSIYENKYHSVPDREIISHLFEQIMESFNSDKLMPQRWGWKEPNTHIILAQLLEFFPELKYIHIIRNGLDMAYSSNQNQPKLWGNEYLNKPYEAGPAFSLSYWCEVHKNIMDMKKRFHDNIHLIYFENLCSDPLFEIGKMLDFCQIYYDNNTLLSLAQKVISPQSMGRFRQFGTEHFDKQDVRFVEELGFSIT